VFDVLFPSLSEAHLWDLTDAHERAISRVNVFIDHVLFSAKESVNSLWKDDILKVRVPDSLVSSFSVTSFRDDFHRVSES
jgi:hypothetical protein